MKLIYLIAARSESGIQRKLKAWTMKSQIPVPIAAVRVIAADTDP